MPGNVRRFFAAQSDADPSKGAGTTFVSLASLASFSGSSAVIVLLWKLAKAFFPHAEAVKSLFVPLILALIIGLVLLLVDLFGQDSATPNPKIPKALAIVLKVVFMLINSALLTAAVLGINATI